MNKYYSYLLATFFLTSTAAFSTTLDASSGAYISNPNLSSGPNQTIYHSEVRTNDARIAINEPNYPTNVYENNRFARGHRHRNMGPEWLKVSQGYGIPEDAVVGGGENGHMLYVCRANLNGNWHPGKLLPNGLCNISYGGREISFRNYQILVSHRQLHWVGSSLGFIPERAIVGGEEYGRVLYICQAYYAGGQHAGKVVGGNCNIPYGGREIALTYFNVLTM